MLSCSENSYTGSCLGHGSYNSSSDSCDCDNTYSGFRCQFKGLRFRRLSSVASVIFITSSFLFHCLFLLLTVGIRRESRLTYRSAMTIYPALGKYFKKFPYLHCDPHSLEPTYQFDADSNHSHPALLSCIDSLLN